MQQKFTKHYCFQCKNSGCFVLKYFSPEDIVSITETKFIRFYKSGDTVYREGEFPENIYFLYDGCLKITKTVMEDKHPDLFYAEPGVIIGYKSVIFSEPHSTSVYAYADSLICEINKDYFLNSFLHNKNFSDNFLKYLSEETPVRQQRIEDFEDFRNS